MVLVARRFDRRDRGPRTLVEADDERPRPAPPARPARRPRADLVLSLRFGLEGEQPLTLKEVGLRLGVTREWVRKIELKAVSKMASNAPPAASTSFTRAAAAKSRARRMFPFAAAVGTSSWQ